MATVDVLITGEESRIGTAALKAAADGARRVGLRVRVTSQFRGDTDWLCIFGAGAARRDHARQQQLAGGGRAVLFDLGYFGAGKDPERAYVRVSVDHFHPQALIGNTEPDPTRFAVHGITLREDADPAGHVVVAGMGQKSREQFNLHDWELRTLEAMQARFPEHRILYRPKKKSLPLPWQPQDGDSAIEDVLRGASLVVCRHSGVAVDACIAGVPVETEDGAARWLYARGTDPDPAERLDFLQRLAWWNWQCSEMEACWKFLLKVCG